MVWLAAADVLTGLGVAAMGVLVAVRSWRERGS